jgi:hypothetical protein
MPCPPVPLVVRVVHFANPINPVLGKTMGFARSSAYPGVDVDLAPGGSGRFNAGSKTTSTPERQKIQTGCKWQFETLARHSLQNPRKFLAPLTQMQRTGSGHGTNYDTNAKSRIPAAAVECNDLMARSTDDRICPLSRNVFASGGNSRQRAAVSVSVEKC